jgi:hypothetical protein
MLSRETMNNILARNSQNGYMYEFKRWEFFRAKCPDELCQIDFKGTFTVGVRSTGFWFASTTIAGSSFALNSLTMS